MKLACDELRTLELYEFSSFFFSIAQTEEEKATNAKQGDVGAKKNDSAGKLASQVRIEKNPRYFVGSTQHMPAGRSI